MRKFALLSLLLVAVLLVAACGGAPQDEAPAEAAVAEEAPAEEAAAEDAGDGVLESPMLAEMVAAGELPPLEERLPAEPFVVGPGVLMSRRACRIGSRVNMAAYCAQPTSDRTGTRTSSS